MIRDGWVCRACWKPNGPAEDRCYRCKTPREGQMEVEAGSRTNDIRPDAHLDGRLDAELPILALLAAWPLRIYGVASIGIGILIFLLALASPPSDEPVLGMDAKVFLGILSFAVVCWGALQIFLAKSVRRHARWAYVIAFLFGLGGALPRLLNLEAADELTGAARTIWLVGPFLYLGVALCAVALLVTSFMRRPTADAAAAAGG